ncbi:hypothetical protein [Chitinimonas koreensis]|uniref:hypothetical protein n=1 Tax=Chitinimonas koreensis TaxID=356302 RepID=UPI0027E510CC|nr:hypothetical protein [Chitinimonas koreensis]
MLGFLARMALKNALRHRLRALLTLAGLTIAVLAFGLLSTVVSAWYAGADAASDKRLITRNAISLVFALPIAYGERIRTVDGVRGLSWANWFGGIYIEEKNFFPQFAIDPASYLPLYPNSWSIRPSRPPSCATARAAWSAGSWPSATAGRSATPSRSRAPSSPAPGPSCCAASTAAARPAPTRTSSSSTGTT